MKKNRIAKTWLVLFIFCFLFAPPLIHNINLIILLGAFSTVAIVFKYLKRVPKLIKQPDFLKVTALLLLYGLIHFGSYAFSSIFSGQEITENYLLTLYSSGLSFVAMPLCAAYILFKFEDLGLKKKDLIRYFIYAGVLQSLIAIVTLISPSIREVTIQMMQKDTNAYLLDSPWLLERRFFGLSNNLLDLFGFGVGILATLPLFYASAENNRKWLICSPIILISAVLNSRTGILVFAIGLIVWLIGLIMTRKINFTRAFVFLVPAGLVLFGGFSAMLVLVPETMGWIGADFKSFFETDASTGTASAIFSEKYWSLPPTSNLLLGTGHNISAYSTHKAETVAYSDNGYINEIWKVGIVGLIVYLSANYIICRTCKRTAEKSLYKYMYTFFWVAILVMLVKSTLTGYNPGSAVTYALFLFSAYSLAKGGEKYATEK